MKAVVYTQYGTPDLMKYQEVKKPVPGADEVLIKMRAVSLNASDWEFLTGSPLYIRMWGLRKPNYQILGSDIAGEVEAVGNKVSRFQPGDAVFGDVLGYWGGLAEYVCAPEKALMLKPDELSFEEAATIPQAGLVAFQGLQSNGKVKPGQKVLINGAGGGSGSFAIQLAHLFGAEVTGVDHTQKLDLMRSLGADHVIDYTSEDFTKNGRQYDLILDLIAVHSIFDYRRALSPGGRYAMVGGSMAHIFQALVLGSLISLSGNKKMGMIAVEANKDLADITELIVSGKISAVIDKCYALEETPEAFRYLGDAMVKGKVVIKI